MRKVFILIFTLIITLFNFNFAKSYSKDDEFIKFANDFGYEVSANNLPKSAILVDAYSGDILWEQNMNLQWDSASTSKIMTLYLVYDAISRGEISFDTKVLATKNDENISQIYELSNNKITDGVLYPVSELIKMAMVSSSNVATIMLANKISNNDTDLFIENMNEKAKELGMTNSYFNNATGAVASAFNNLYLPQKFDNNGYNISTAKDLAILTYNFLNNYPDALTFTKDYEVSTMLGTPYEEKLTNHNHSLKGAKYEFAGVDGLKTGSSPSSGFNIVATAKQENTRLIAVVLGVGNFYERENEYYRHIFVNSLFNKGFNEYETKNILTKGSHKINDKEIILLENYFDLVPKNKNYNYKLVDNKLLIENNLENINQTKKEKGVPFKENNTIYKITNNYKKLNLVHKILLIIGIVIILVITIQLLIKKLKDNKK